MTRSRAVAALDPVGLAVARAEDVVAGAAVEEVRGRAVGRLGAADVAAGQRPQVVVAVAAERLVGAEVAEEAVVAGRRR